MNKHPDNSKTEESSEKMEEINQEIEEELYQLHYGNEPEHESEEIEPEEPASKSIIFMYIMIGALSIGVIGKMIAIGLKLVNIL